MGGVADLLEQTLRQEKATEAKLTAPAEGEINPGACSKQPEAACERGRLDSGGTPSIRGFGHAAQAGCRTRSAQLDAHGLHGTVNLFELGRTRRVRPEVGR